MLPILINATLIWLASLLVYELVLKQTTFHRLNRGFLLLTFVAGVVLPLLPWSRPIEIRELNYLQNGIPAIPAPSSQPTELLTGSGSSVQIDWIMALWICGSAIVAVRLLRELWRIRGIYKAARRSRDGRWIIAETGIQHGPFSFLNIIFVSDRQDYSPIQWQMLRQHEEQHFRSAHLLDLLLLQSATVLLWFHPLVHIYRSRIRLIHEFEVDSLQAGDTISYGRFLLEQAASRPMAMTHALNYSPLKNRIQMMTKQSSPRRAQARYLLLLPLLSCAIWCCTKTQAGVGIDIKDRYATRQDAKLGYPKQAQADTIMMVDPVTNKQQQVVMTIEPKPETLNGQAIVKRAALSKAPECRNPGSNFGFRYLVEKSALAPTLEKMADGEYFMAVSDVIVDQSGRVAYYMLTFPENHADMTSGSDGINFAKPNGLSDADKAEIQRRLAATLIGGEVAFSAATDASGKAVAYYLDSDFGKPDYKLSGRIRISGHKMQLME